jgi:hypothetical protein
MHQWEIGDVSEFMQAVQADKLNVVTIVCRCRGHLSHFSAKETGLKT